MGLSQVSADLNNFTILSRIISIKNIKKKLFPVQDETAKQFYRNVHYQKNYRKITENSKPQQ